MRGDTELAFSSIGAEQKKDHKWVPELSQTNAAVCARGIESMTCRK